MLSKHRLTRHPLRHSTNTMVVRLSQIPITSLIQVLAVAERLNFRHAATSLGVSQSRVSTRIKALEDRLGIVIFERRHRGVRLTDAGRRFVAEVPIGMGHLDHAIVTAGAISSGEIGSIRMGISSRSSAASSPNSIAGSAPSVRRST